MITSLLDGPGAFRDTDSSLRLRFCPRGHGMVLLAEETGAAIALAYFTGRYAHNVHAPEPLTLELWEIDAIRALIASRGQKGPVRQDHRDCPLDSSGTPLLLWEREHLG